MNRFTKLRRCTFLLGLIVPGILFMQPASSQQMGRDGYSFPVRSSSLAAQFDFQRRMAASASASSAEGINALTQYVTTYSSNSTSIGNMNTINQTLGDSASGSIGASADQASEGNQGSGATTDAAIDNSLTNSGTINEILMPTTPTATN